MKRRLLIQSVFFCCAVLFSLMTVVVQVRALGQAYVEREQWDRHLAIIQQTANAPYQYRVLSAYLLEGTLRVLTALDCPHPVLVAMLEFRIAQNILLFLLAAFYYQTLGCRTVHVLLGLSLLAWGMTHALYDSDLAFNTYSDVIFYLAAGLVLLQKHDGWIIPITILAAFNRETSGLIPFMVVAAHYQDLKYARRNTKPVILVAASALTAYLIVFGGLRYLFGPRPLSIPYEHQPGFDLLRYNLGRPITWMQLFATLGILPILAILSFQRWHPLLRAFFWTVAPIWFVIHAFGSVMAESRLFLVPLALIFVPGTLFSIQDRD
jgi:hypothetical protein